MERAWSTRRTIAPFCQLDDSNCVLYSLYCVEVDHCAPQEEAASDVEGEYQGTTAACKDSDGVYGRD